MMHTEEQANHKRCPLLELIQALHSSTAPGGPAGSVGCIASDCMAWRWGENREESKNHQVLKSGEKPEGFVDHDTTDADGFKWSSSDDGRRCDWYQFKFNEHGYCGLAGKAE